ncbi:nitrogen fixation protein NifZ [Candidatus Thiodiazotropha sp. CDECU1]|uniref:nitrogen fixation protein NifZ n=1 Tax=Candidatus Thiodiazotropha sp. CDECU1 TaxID=3065865 RepID=UPI002930DA70|nr:nitrogen fixation protein NifZ [Candidatus Thiodiazotropha sp. CDECU1]
MRPKFEYGAQVRVVRNLRNDGTYPGEPTGRLLVRRGSVGYVRDVGTFLQDQLIYSVDFLDDNRRVGCREQELQLATDPWIPTRFEFREKVTPTMPLGIQGEVIANPGDPGEIEKVLQHHPGGPAYHVRFSGRTLQVPETALAFLSPDTMEVP